ncbi:PP2C family protein-serine/threonine phosphatase [Dermacoccaceae bacterium W4C1]
MALLTPPETRTSANRVLSRARAGSQIPLTTVTVLAALAVCGAAAVQPSSAFIPLLVPVVVAAGLFLHSVQMYVVYAATAAGLLIAAVVSATIPTTVGALAVVMLLMIALDRRRAGELLPPELGAELMLDLRDRIVAQGRTPQSLPTGWQVNSCVEAAHGDPFAGDFVLMDHDESGETLQVVLADVTGCGTRCATRSLTLAGALSGLLGSVPGEQFLSAANRYLLRQSWQDACATAVHVEIDLDSGWYRVSSAGHPGVLHRNGQAGRSQVRQAAGVMLGVVDSELADYQQMSGHLEVGDSLILFSDGLIEGRDGDLDRGLERLRSAARKADVSTGPCPVALVATAAAGEGDDRSAVVIHRAH